VIGVEAFRRDGALIIFGASEVCAVVSMQQMYAYEIPGLSSHPREGIAEFPSTASAKR
jgi:hypothetical protein